MQRKPYDENDEGHNTPGKEGIDPDHHPPRTVNSLGSIVLAASGRNQKHLIPLSIPLKNDLDTSASDPERHHFVGFPFWGSVQCTKKIQKQPAFHCSCN